jgi:hypothetical protein
MNIGVAWLIFAALFAVGIRPISIIPDELVDITSHSRLMPTLSRAEQQGIIEIQEIPAQVQDILPDSLANQIDIASGSIITHINGVAVSTQTLSKTLNPLANQAISIQRSYQDQPYSKKIICGDPCLLGVMIDSGTATINPIKAPIWKAPLRAIQEVCAQSRLSLIML